MNECWTQAQWRSFERRTAVAALASREASGTWDEVARAARSVLRTYSTSFFIVTRFLPIEKRKQVEVIYSAVRYPDEAVDTFPISSVEKREELHRWGNEYELGLRCDSLKEGLASGRNCFITAFTQVVRRNGIPPEYYRAFLQAMTLDIAPRTYADNADLIDSYIYGSAIVVGYFLAYVYGASAPSEFERALGASKHLGIALQLTNFLRDVLEDHRRGRIYLPMDLLRAEGIRDLDFADPSSHAPLNRVLRQLSATAESHYAEAERNLDAFAPDCRMAIQACVNVYRQLNLRIGRSPAGILHRESVPGKDKFRVLPASKYWRLPLAYMGAL